MSKRSVIGIIGGMGPHAGVELARLCTVLADCRRDQDHPDLLLHSRPGSLPDRSDFLAGRSAENPAAGILAVARELVNAGATAIGVACNTSHAPAIMDPVRNAMAREAPQVRLLSLVEAGAMGAVRAAQGLPVGLLATEGTYLSRLYDEAIERLGATVMWPTPADRRAIHAAIYDADWGIKAMSQPVSPQARLILDEAMMALLGRGAGSILLGCTELPLALDPAHPGPCPRVDPMRELAAALLVAAGVPVRRGAPTESSPPSGANA